MGQPEEIDAVTSFTIENVGVDVHALSPEYRRALLKRADEYQRDLERRLLGVAESKAPKTHNATLVLRPLRPRHAKRCAKRVRRELRRMVLASTIALRIESLTDRAWFFGDPKRYALERYERRRERARLRRLGHEAVIPAWWRAAWRTEMLEQRRIGKAIAGALADTFQSFGWPISRRMLGGE